MLALGEQAIWAVPERAPRAPPHPDERLGRDGEGMSELDAVRELVDAALRSLEASRQRIDDLNVYPVPDGDTGTNLTLTMRAMRDSLGESTAADRASIAHDVTRAALMGARGNSGVIFSQIVRGAAETLGAAAAIEEAVLTRAFRAASDAAYAA